jgi:hypothetical protein
MRTTSILLFLALLTGCAAKNSNGNYYNVYYEYNVINGDTTLIDVVYDKSSRDKFTRCLDSLGGSDTDCIDCQILVYGSVIDSTYLF